MDVFTILINREFKSDGILRLDSVWNPELAKTPCKINLVGEGNRFIETTIRPISGSFGFELKINPESAASFLKRHRLKAGDCVRLVQIGDQRLRLCPIIESMRFIDLFAGIGGMRLAFEAAGGECVFSSEWNKFAQKTYEANHGDWPVGDICDVAANEIPDHDILVGGFPCQPFSIAGVSKKNSLGREHGFRDEAQGTLFFDVARIIDEKRPAAFVLENVKNLHRHDKGRTFAIIERTLRDELGYQIQHRVIDGKTVVPQHRERIYIVGLRDGGDFDFPDAEQLQSHRHYDRLGELLLNRPPAKYRLSDKLWQYLQDYAEKHRKAGNGFGYGLVGRNDTTRTLSARYHKDGSEILVRFGKGNPRRLTPRECARLMGFPDTFQIPVSDTQAYKQFGNSVVVPVVQAIAENLVSTLVENRRKKQQSKRQRIKVANG